MLSNGRPHSRSATAREERENSQLLNSPWLEGGCEVVDNDVVMLQVNQHRLRSCTKPRGQDEKEARAGTAAPTMESEAWRDHFGSVYGGPVRLQRIDKEATKDDRRTGRQTGGGEGGETRGEDYGAGTSPAAALAHVPCCETQRCNIDTHAQQLPQLQAPSKQIHW